MSIFPPVPKKEPAAAATGSLVLFDDDHRHWRQLGHLAAHAAQELVLHA